MASEPVTASEPQLNGAEPTVPLGNGDVEQAHVHRGSGDLIATKDAPVGGQAVIEGVMMRGVKHWAVAVRLEDGTISTETHDFVSKAKNNRFYRWPVVRG